jgi:hypothetical protein
MKCSDFEKSISQLAGNGLIEASTQAAVLRHVEGCEQCAARLAGERMLISGVRAVRAEIANEQAPAHVEQALRNAFRTQDRAAVLVMPQRKRRLTSWKAAAIAAAILLAASIGAIVLVRSFTDKDTLPPQVNVPLTVPNSPAPSPKVQDVRDQVTQVNTPRRRAKKVARHSEMVTEYFPLIEGDDLNSVEFTQVVRVELTPSALREVGLPSTYAAEGEFIKADVVLGNDGIARAIRFVR